jgi:DNA-directed RNA polymerase subunit RPC12/RpoP
LSRTTRVFERRGFVAPIEQGFVCAHCGGYVSCDRLTAGVQNRNHCPYCLWSRHLDWREAGDRMAGCRAPMRPIGLTTKRGRNKYARAHDGELMLVHRCEACGQLSINRIAADDLETALLEILDRSSKLDVDLREALERSGVVLLSDERLLRRRLLGGG